MSLPLTRQEYHKLILEDLEWLYKQPRTLERDHIETIIKDSEERLYPTIPPRMPRQWVDPDQHEG